MSEQVDSREGLFFRWETYKLVSILQEMIEGMESSYKCNDWFQRYDEKFICDEMLKGRENESWK